MTYSFHLCDELENEAEPASESRRASNLGTGDDVTPGDDSDRPRDLDPLTP